MFDKIDYKTVRLAGREVRLTINHSERSISARLNDSYPTELRLTGYLSKHLAIGASVRVEYGGDEDVLAGLYLGPLRLYLAGSHRALGNILAACKTGRRVTSIEAELGERFGDEGPEIRVRGNLWNDDNEGHPRSRAFSVDLLDSLFGKPVTSDKRVIEERMAVVPLPEGSFTTKARLVERFVSRPGWPFKTFSRWVEFRETPAVVPRRKSNGVSFYNQGGPWTCVTGSTIEDGVAELVRRVLEDRGRYGGKRWATGIPVIEEHRDSHEVSVWQIVDGKEIEHWRGAVQHRSVFVKDGTVGAYSPVSLPDAGLCLSRDARVGGIVASSIGGKVLSIQRGGETISPFLDGHAERAIVFQGDKVHTERGCWKIYGSPIGPLLAPPAAPADVLGPVWKDPTPATPATPAGPADVRAATILARGEAARVHVNAGPAIGKTGRIPLRAMTVSAIEMARSIDPEWVAANQEIVAGAGPGKLYDGARWVTVLPENVRLTLDNPDREGWASFNFAAKLDWYEAQERAKQDAAAQAELDRSIALVDDVERTLAQLDTTPPGPTEEAEGVVARENAMGQISERSVQAMSSVVSALSAVLGNGESDLPPAPVDTRPWMPTGDLVVVVARGELRQTIRLDCAPSHRIGAHKDAEVRLLGAHTIAATLLQQDGAVWICRGADNVAVDLLGLDIRETVRLREGAEVQIGSMYTLTITSAAKSAA